MVALGLKRGEDCDNDRIMGLFNTAVTSKGSLLRLFYIFGL